MTNYPPRFDSNYHFINRVFGIIIKAIEKIDQSFSH